MSRIDYYDDPQAPPANSLVPAASAIVVDDLGRLLLHRRRDNDKWALPGGAMELGESLRECVVREVREETGFDVDVVGIVGTYSDPDTCSRTTTARYDRSSRSASCARSAAARWRRARNRTRFASSK
jgi:ADP-ribose pyrophosphatase YjhB (NUDIX family)